MLSFSTLRCASALAVAGVVTSFAGAAQADTGNFVNLLLSKVNNQDTGFVGYHAQLEFEFGDAVTSVVGLNGGNDIGLFEEDPGRWTVGQNYPTLGAMAADIIGAYTFTVTTNTGTSTMNFTLTNALAALTDNNFLAMPQITNPTLGQTGVVPQPLFTWNPNGNDTDPAAFVVSVSMESNTVWADDINVNGGSMNIADTQWQSAQALNGGHATFTVEYGTTDPSLVPVFLNGFSQDVGTGGIVWTMSPYAPAGYQVLTDGTPLLAVLSSNTVGFEVVPEPATLALLALAGPAMLMRRRAR